MKDAALIISTGATACLFADAAAATERAERSNEKRIILLAFWVFGSLAERSKSKNEIFLIEKNEKIETCALTGLLLTLVGRLLFYEYSRYSLCA